MTTMTKAYEFQGVPLAVKNIFEKRMKQKFPSISGSLICDHVSFTVQYDLSEILFFFFFFLIYTTNLFLGSEVA